MAKKIDGYIKLQVPAGKANPSPPIGPALGQRGLNIMEFCKSFNAATQKMEPEMPLPVIITVYSDRSFTFQIKSPPASYFLKKAAGLEKSRFLSVISTKSVANFSALSSHRAWRSSAYLRRAAWMARSSLV